MNRRRFKKALKRIALLPSLDNPGKYIANKLRHIWLRMIRSTSVAYPSTIMLELTTHCNLACTICPHESEFGREMDKGNMELSLAKGVIDEVSPYLDSIGLTGMGETFLYRDLEEIINYIRTKNKGIIISVSTNAVVPDFIPKVSGLINRVDTIQVSVDGIEDVYESIRRNASFRQLDANLKALAGLCRGSNTDLLLNMVVTKENYKHMPLLVQYAADAGIEYAEFTLFNLASVTGIDVSYYEFYQSDEFLNTIDLVDKASRGYPGVKITKRDFTGSRGFNKCPFPWGHFYVSWNGYIPPCCAKPFPREMNFGKIPGNRIIDLLNCQRFREFRKLWFKNITPEFCKRCHFIGIEPIKRI